MKKYYFIILFITLSNLHSQNNIFDVCRNGNVEDIKILYKQNPDIINKKNDAGYSPLILACYHNNEEIAKFLINNIKDVNESSDYGTPLMAAVVKGHITIIELLLEKNADPNIQDIKGTTALHYASMSENIEIANLLVNANANCNLKNNVGKTPMDFAISLNNQDLITILKNN